MFDAVRNNKRFVQVFLVLITLPFAFFGVESYVNGANSNDDVAKIGDATITQQQYQRAMSDQQDRLRTQMGAQFDPKMLDNPAARRAIIDDLVDQRLLLIEANKQHLIVSDQAIRQTILSIDAFKVDGKFSSERYEAALRAQGMSPTGFEAQLRQDIMLQQLAGVIGQTSLMSRTVGDRVLALQTEKRDVMEHRLALDNYLTKVKLEEGAVKKFYDENQKQFETPEQAKAEYVELSMASIGAQLTVSDKEIKDWYDSHRDSFQQPEERRASHILIGIEKLDKAKAQAKAEEILKEIRKNPADFGKLAKKNSDDPGSAAQNGDLGFFARGMMVKPFEETVFTMKEGDISSVVESDFGFHIIKLTGIHPTKVKALSEVKAEIEAELKKTAATRKFAEAAENFSNTVYEQADSLKPAADKFKLTVKQSNWVGRQANPANGALGNEKLLAALFSQDSIKTKRNTESVEIAPNTLVAARLVEYKPAAIQPLEAVRSSIETLLQRKAAQEMAKKEGEMLLESVKKGEDKLAWGGSKLISRLDSRLIPPAAVPAVFKMDAEKLPAYTGVELPGMGYSLFKLSKVSADDKLEPAHKEAMLVQLGKLSAQEEVQGYLAALRSRYKVEINQAAVEAKDK